MHPQVFEECEGVADPHESGQHFLDIGISELIVSPFLRQSLWGRLFNATPQKQKRHQNVTK